MDAVNLKDVVAEFHANGSARKIRGDMALPKGKPVEGAVLEFLGANASQFKLNIDAKSLRLVHKADTPTRSVLRYQQLVNNIPVFNSQVIVQTDRKNTVKQLDLDHATDLRIVSPTPNKKPIDTKQAAALALKSLGAVKVRKSKPAPPELVYQKTDQGLRLAYHVLVLTENPMHDWSILLDAQSGEILEKADLIQELPNGSGMVFDPNPVVTANSNALRQPTATVAGGCGYAGSTVATIDAQRVTRTLKDLKLAGGVYSLDGPYAKIVDITTPSSTIPTETSATAFNYSSSDERLGAVNLYYHIDTIQRYIQSLGITTANNRQTQADPAVTGFSAYYSPGDKSLHMGISRPCHPDKSQEGDAIIHEYGHAIQDNQVPGWGGTNPVTHRNEAGAMGEGFGDTLACVFFANAGNQFQRETFEDWAYVENGASGLRRVDGSKVYPTDWSSEVHNDGEIWSAALWKIYRTIGGDSLTLASRQAARDALLKSVILSHHLLATNASMPDGAEAVMTTNAELDDYRGAHLVQMLNSFHDRGILKCDSGVDLFLRDDASDTGAEPFGGSVFWESPDLWVRHADDNGTTHQEPEFGQDNYFYARVKNRGTKNARAFVVTFNPKPWAGVEFVYPADFTPYVSAAVGFNLAPGASTIVKAKWPAAMVPVAGTHSCLLGQVYIPTETTPSGSHVWDKNNLAQKNMTVVDALPDQTISARFQLGSLHQREANLYNVELVRPPKWTGIGVSLMAENAFETKKLFNSIADWKPATAATPLQPATTLHFPERATAEVTGRGLADTPLRINLAAGSTISTGLPTPTGLKAIPFEREAQLTGTGAQLAAIQFNPGKAAGFPVLLQPGAQLKCVLNITVPADAKPGESLKFQLMQRHADGKLAGGITIVVNVKNK